MSRIRLLRIVLPIVLVGVLVAVGLTLRSRPGGGTTTDVPSADGDARMEGFRFSDLVGGRRRLLVQAKVGRVDERGAFDLEDVDRLEVDREQQTPLLLTAKRGAGSGPLGKRVVRLEGGVTLHDDDNGIDIEIPSVEVDQVGGVVRSLGAVRLKHADWNGTASGVIYSLTGEPTRLLDLSFDGPDGGHLAARRGSLPAGNASLTLEGEVEASQGGMTVRAEHVLLVRGADGRLESVTATPSVTGTAASLGGGTAAFAAREVQARWDRNGKIEGLLLSGGAHVQQVHGTIAADRIEAKTLPPAGTISVTASTQVVATGTAPKGGASTLACDALQGTLDPAGMVRDGLATGHVRFDGEGAAGEAAEARVTSFAPDGTVTLTASPERRARLANGRIRIIADSIVSDTRGVKLKAEGKVESTLLPASGAQAAVSSPMFVAGEAVHFVSASLDSAGSGAHLILRGDVRGWQGERTLSADEVEMVQSGEVLNARGHVATRLPREASRATSEADYVQVSAETLNYRGGAHNAEYDGNVKVRQAEGWLQAPHLMATLAEGGPGLREVQAVQGVRFEYRSPGDRGVPNTATGDGDRAVYDATARVLRIYGEKAPATVRSTGPKGGTTVGRVLRYDLATGALEVESGERDRATIRTPKE